MIDFSSLKICEKTKKALSSFDINFVFQPIFDRNLQLNAYEALMRPIQMSVTELIRLKMEKNSLHEMELATFFGAMMAFRERNYPKTVNLHINSFPSENFTDQESLEYAENIGINENPIVIEILEYMSAEASVWKNKRRQAQEYKMDFALDDFGAGYSGLGSVDFYNPKIIKIDRSLISNIDKSSVKQINLNKFLKLFHSQNRLVLAEGIETQQELDYLLKINIDLFQGYFLGMPQ